MKKERKTPQLKFGLSLVQGSAKFNLSPEN